MENVVDSQAEKNFVTAYFSFSDYNALSSSYLFPLKNARK